MLAGYSNNICNTPLHELLHQPLWGIISFQQLLVVQSFVGVSSNVQFFSRSNGGAISFFREIKGVHKWHYTHRWNRMGRGDCLYYDSLYISLFLLLRISFYSILPFGSQTDMAWRHLSKTWTTVNEYVDDTLVALLLFIPRFFLRTEISDCNIYNSRCVLILDRLCNRQSIGINWCWRFEKKLRKKDLWWQLSVRI